jgi:hypothetical protein
MFFQKRLHDSPLDADSSAVNDPDLSKPLLMALKKVFCHNFPYVAGSKTVQVQGVLNGEFMQGPIVSVTVLDFHKR